MFGVSPYLYLLQQQRGFGQPALGIGQPEQEPDDPFAPDAASRRRARNQGLTALGMALLEGAPRGDLSGGLARGIAGFQEASTGSFDRDLALALQAAEERRRDAAETRAGNADARAAAQETDRGQMFGVQYDAAQTELQKFKDDQTRAQQIREATGKSAEQMVAEIDALAAANPNDQKLQLMSKRAIGYSLGEASDLDKLTLLHREMTDEASEQSDYAEETAMGLGRAREQAGLGFGPVAEGRRAEEGLAVERQRTAYYGQQVNKQLDRDPDVTPQQFQDDVASEKARLYKQKLDQLETNYNRGMPRPQPDGKGGYKVLPAVPYNERDLARIDREAEEEARVNVANRYGASAGVGSGATGANPTTRYRWDPQQGKLVPIQ